MRLAFRSNAILGYAFQFNCQAPCLAQFSVKQKRHYGLVREGGVRASMWMEPIKAGADAHAVMPGDRKSPPHQRAENRLPQSKRKDVALLTEQPGAANQSEGDEDGIGPVKQGKERASDEGNPNGARDGSKEAIGNEGV